MDQGGTFTDVVHIDNHGRWHISKHLSDAADLGGLAAGASDVRRGTTVATNALLERTLSPVVLVTTAGFEDMLEVGVQVRPELFARTVRRVAPLGVRVVSIPGRLGADGSVVTPLDLSDLEAKLHGSDGLPTAVAIALSTGRGVLRVESTRACRRRHPPGDHGGGCGPRSRLSGSDAHSRSGCGPHALAPATSWSLDVF